MLINKQTRRDQFKAKGGVKRADNRDNDASEFPAELGSCESADITWLRKNEEAGTAYGPGFNCFRQQLAQSLSKWPDGHLAELRKALADFLFQYKMAHYYPRDFVPWNQGASAQALDSSLEPLIVAFNRDLAVYLRHCQDRIEREKDKKVDFSSSGIVTARVISGNPAKVETLTQNFFPMPPTLSVRDTLKQLTQKDFNAPSVLTDNLSGNAAQLVTAAILAEQRTTAKVGRSLTLDFTANTLAGASGSEMNVTLDSSEGGNPTLLNANESATSEHNLNRVAKHSISTKVRIDSQKLFEISSFAAALQHGRSIPLIPPFIEFPYLGNLARLRLAPGTVFHRSFAVVSAVIVPTAADLANRIEFSEDLEPRPYEQNVTLGPINPRKGSGGRRMYYWLVTHYREGSYLSDPIPVSGAPYAYGTDQKVRPCGSPRSGPYLSHYCAPIARIRLVTEGNVKSASWRVTSRPRT